MSYVVTWVPHGPDITVRCPTAEDAVELAAELQSTGRFHDLRIMRDDQEVDIAALARSMAETAGA